MTQQVIQIAPYSWVAAAAPPLRDVHPCFVQTAPPALSRPAVGVPFVFKAPEDAPEGSPPEDQRDGARTRGLGRSPKSFDTAGTLGSTSTTLVSCCVKSQATERGNLCSNLSLCKLSKNDT